MISEIPAQAILALIGPRLIQTGIIGLFTISVRAWDTPGRREASPATNPPSAGATPASWSFPQGRVPISKQDGVQAKANPSLSTLPSFPDPSSCTSCSTWTLGHLSLTKWTKYSLILIDCDDNATVHCSLWRAGRPLIALDRMISRVIMITGKVPPTQVAVPARRPSAAT